MQGKLTCLTEPHVADPTDEGLCTCVQVAVLHKALFTGEILFTLITTEMRGIQVHNSDMLLQTKLGIKCLGAFWNHAAVYKHHEIFHI